ncbi:suppressor of cytokine signaling 2-like [Corticium candelabrum]|uniref:suppressor of cytokine signaling 2-like n=1 Tax=Corticium candelabrum TaxID=121492 RepID=UPI002E2EE16A|nr:suppressor of cytokine signaling 2-like [Corticium candelabrum]
MSERRHRALSVGARNGSSSSSVSNNTRRMCLSRVLQTLRESGWYWGPLTNADAQKLLEKTADGTFLLRDSSDERHLFTITFKVEGIVSSIRLELYRGLFRLYSSECGSCPAFDCVVSLVNFYIKNNVRLFWLERTDAPRISVKLKQPLLTAVPTLQHWCRLSINSCTHPDMIRKLPLPRKLKSYVSDYQH